MERADVRKSKKKFPLKRITIFHRLGHQLAEEAEACLMALDRAGISAHLGNVQHGHNIIVLEGEEDVIRATTLLRGDGSSLTCRVSRYRFFRFKLASED
jgi:hypothetical protein